jgi:hypothetical protein
MGGYPVDDGELVLYFIFTFLSILSSLALYFFYQHCQGYAENDHREYVKILG